MANNLEIPYGCCHCGCGQRTNINKKNRPDQGYVKGDHSKYIRGHSGVLNRGKKRSDEIKAMVSEQMKGNKYRRGTKLSEEYLLKISLGLKRAWALGKFSNRKKCDPALINHQWRGKPLPDEIKKKLSIKLSGENAPNWQGGITCEPYCVIWTDEYKDFIKERDKYKCSNIFCNNKQTKLVVHHIDYIKKNCEPKNLITLCCSCNSRANYNRNSWEAIYKLILNRKYGYQYLEAINA